MKNTTTTTTTTTTAAASVGFRPRDIARLFVQNRRRWLIPTFIGGVVGVVAALWMPRYWEASQALIVRDTATGGEQHQLGRFSSLEVMKTQQETVLELAKSKSVVEATLKEIGPLPGQQGSDSWPSDRVIDDFRKQVRMMPPSGAEFGMTEVFYLGIRSKTRDRALKLVGSLGRHLDERFRSLRDKRAQSMIAELEDAASIAEANLVSATEELTAFESEVGADLTELRMLHTSPSASSALRQRLVAAENAKRLHENRKRQDEELLTSLHAVLEDPNELIATPDLLLSSQPALKRLKDGLVDAQLATASLLGTRSETHPEVLAAKEAEEKVRRHLHDEISAAIKGIEVSLLLSTARVSTLGEQLNEGQTRLERLAQRRAEYANLVTLTDNRTKLAEAARDDLAEVRAAQASARAASLIQQIDGPETGVNPVGPGRTVVAGAGLIGGFVIGLGLLFLFTELPSSAPLQVLARTAESKSAAPTGHSAFTAPTMQESTAPPNAAAHSADGAVVTAVSEETVDSLPPANKDFGLFQGMSLHEACQQVATRERKDVDKT